MLGNAELFDPRIVRLNGTASTEAVLAAMEAHPTSERVAGLGSIAMANLVYKVRPQVASVKDDGDLTLTYRLI